jgi:uncharacterized protein
MSHFIYLHGWGSSPTSHKALFLHQQIPTLMIPDLNQNDFYHLSLSRQIAQVQALLPATGDITLIGSSFGALTALWLAQHHLRITQLALLAPAINFHANLTRILGIDRLQQWQAQGELMVYHNGWAKEVLLNYAFIDDMHTYPDHALKRALPTVIFHGSKDEIIPLSDVTHFCAQRPWVEMNVYADDHRLSASLEQIWRRIQTL